MKDIMSSSGGFSSARISAMGGDPKDNNYIWTTEKIDQLIDDINNGVKDVRKLGMSPFKDNDINLRRENLPFEYTPEEIEELAKCKSSLLYFAINYCVITTPGGRKILKDAGGLRDFQEQILKAYKDNPLNILMASRQTGKTVTSAIFMLWFLLFHPEKTALCVADNFTTTKELIDKFRIALEGLPFYMKPGIDTINQSNIKFDSNSRLVGRTTTKKSGIGLTVNLLYIDEFAHINDANLDDFYRAIFPTVTADPNGRIIITSTPNGKNKFWEIWKDAVNGTSSYYPIRVDWWQIPGRDEDWKKQKIADLGSVEDFNQEYGLQFHSSDKLLLNSKDLRKLDIIKQEYVNNNIFLNEDLYYLNDYIFNNSKIVSNIKNLIETSKISQPNRLKKQLDGDELDLDSCIENVIDIKRGSTPAGNIYKKTQRKGRDLAASVLVDISESTNDLIKETKKTIFSSLVESTGILSEAINLAGDNFQLSTFCSNKREDVRFWKIKDFNEKEKVLPKNKLESMKPGYSTRLGAAIRQAGIDLMKQPNYRKLLLILSDGEPSDIDVEDKEYLLQDAKYAVRRLAYHGVDVFCVGIESESNRFLSRIFGNRNYVIIKSASDLPEKLPLIYLTLSK